MSQDITIFTSAKEDVLMYVHNKHNIREYFGEIFQIDTNTQDYNALLHHLKSFLLMMYSHDVNIKCFDDATQVETIQIDTLIRYYQNLQS